MDPAGRGGPMELIEGRQPVREAIRAGRAIRRLLVAEGAQARGALAEILDLAAARGVDVERVPRPTLDRMARTGRHQGVIAEAEARKRRSWRDAVGAARSAGRAPLVLALDGIQDPQNLGALLRSAEAFGVDAVLVPRRRSAPLGPGVARAAAGALEHLVVDQVANLERTLAACRDDGLWLVALAGEGAVGVQECALLGEPAVVIVGAEGRGVSPLVLRRADAVVRIPTAGNVASLNASVAGAICLWEATRRRANI